MIIIIVIGIGLFFGWSFGYISDQWLQPVAAIFTIIAALATVFALIPEDSNLGLMETPTEAKIEATFLPLTVTSIPFMGTLISATVTQALSTRTEVPTETPIEVPTKISTQTPTKIPTQTPTQMPTQTSTKIPTKVPTNIPTQAPTEVPTKSPTKVSTKVPTLGIGSTIVGQDGMTLLYVPEGEFLMGSKENDPSANSNEQLQRLVYLDAFWIDQTEVTNEMFARFINKTRYQTDSENEELAEVFTGTIWKQIDGANWQHPLGPQSTINGLGKHPVTQISWNDANAYCKWAGRRLPTEAEWEKAARGTNGWKYPWGNESVVRSKVNFCDNNCLKDWKDNSVDDGYQFTAPVGTYSNGASFYGALDMAGNVWEWVADWYDKEYYKDAPLRNPPGPTIGEFKALRGGSLISDEKVIRSAYRVRADLTVSVNDWGFRCAASP